MLPSEKAAHFSCPRQTYALSMKRRMIPFNGAQAIFLCLNLLALASPAFAQFQVDPAQWREYLKQAELGDNMAQLRMGFLYEKGRGVEQDWTQACRWYRLAAEGKVQQAQAQAQADLGRCHAKGLGGLVRDEAAALAWYKKSAEGGSPSGHQALGLAYETGLGVTSAPEKAFQHLLVASKAGLDVAQGVLGIQLATGRGTPEDRGQARYWLKRSAESGNTGAARYLDKMGPPNPAEQLREAEFALNMVREERSALKDRAKPILTAECGSDKACWARKTKVLDELQALFKVELDKEQAAWLAAQANDQEVKRLALQQEVLRAKQAAIDRGAFHIFGFALGAPIGHYLPGCDEWPTADACTKIDGDQAEVSFRKDVRPAYLFDLRPDRVVPAYTTPKTCLLEDGYKEVSCFGGDWVPEQRGYKAVVGVSLVDGKSEHVRFNFSPTPANNRAMEGMLNAYFGRPKETSTEGEWRKTKWFRGDTNAVIGCRDRQPSHCYVDVYTAAFR